jgi:hypothetical protein
MSSTCPACRRMTHRRCCRRLRRTCRGVFEARHARRSPGLPAALVTVGFTPGRAGRLTAGHSTQATSDTVMRCLARSRPGPPPRRRLRVTEKAFFPLRAGPGACLDPAPKLSSRTPCPVPATFTPDAWRCRHRRQSKGSWCRVRLAIITTMNKGIRFVGGGDRNGIENNHFQLFRTYGRHAAASDP